MKTFKHRCVAGETPGLQISEFWFFNFGRRAANKTSSSHEKFYWLGPILVLKKSIRIG